MIFNITIFSKYLHTRIFAEFEESPVRIHEKGIIGTLLINFIFIFKKVRFFLGRSLSRPSYLREGYSSM
jgi:hypothetical protein